MTPISVVIPSRNEGGNILRTVRSLVEGRSSGFPLEVVVVDDDSTDGSCDRLADAVGSAQNSGQPSRLAGPRLIWVALCEALYHAGHRGDLLIAGEFSPPGVAPDRPCQLRYQDPVSLRTFIDYVLALPRFLPVSAAEVSPGQFDVCCGRLGACIPPIGKMLSMRLLAASQYRRRGRAPAC